MTAKIYRGLISLLLLFTIGKFTSIVSPEETVQAMTVNEEMAVNDLNKVNLTDVPVPSEQMTFEEFGEEIFSDGQTESEETIADIVNTSSVEQVNEELNNQEKNNSMVEEKIVEEEVSAERTFQEIEKMVDTSSRSSNEPMTMYINNQAISYENGGEVYGQSIIDRDYNKVSTWGGASVQSGNDGLTTHFIGHNPGIFSVLFDLSIGSEVGVTDGNGNLSTYHVIDIWVVDNSGYEVNSGEDTWDRITSPYQGEAIVLQTCIDDYTNLILFAIN